MIDFVRGALAKVHDEGVVLDVGGIGYDVATPPIVLDDLRNLDPGTEVTLVTHHYLQMDQSKGIPVLVGFRTEEEREFCLALAAVVGPKSALRSLAAPISHIAQSIELGDPRFLKSLPGIGPQKAREIIARLQGKVGRYVGFEIEPLTQVTASAAGRGDFVSEAIEALISLDYKRPEAVQMVNHALVANANLSNVEEVLQQVFSR